MKAIITADGGAEYKVMPKTNFGPMVRYIPPEQIKGQEFRASSIKNKDGTYNQWTYLEGTELKLEKIEKPKEENYTSKVIDSANGPYFEMDLIAHDLALKSYETDIANGYEYRVI